MRLSSDPAARRRLAGLAATAALALLAGAAVGAGSDGGDGAEGAAGTEAETEERRRLAVQAVERLSLRTRVGQVTVSTFEGTTVPGFIRRRLRSGETAGVILFSTNASGAAGWRRLTRSLQRPARGGGLVMVDQEGGDIRALPHVGPWAGQPLQGSPKAVRRAALAAGRGLRAAGVNVNLAPVADVAVPGSVMAGRAFPGGARGVSRRTRASVRGLGAARVAATAKHFPGLGRSAVNTDDGPATVSGELSGDLSPFRAAIAEDVSLVMLSHAAYPALDPRAIASQSPAVVSGLLRRELGFGGAVITDSLEAAAVLARSGVATAAERSIRAGADLILMTGSASWNEVYPRLLARARSSAAFRARISESAARVLELKRRLGLRLPRG